MENFYVYYKDEPTLKHYSYYPLTKESKVLKRPDLQAHRYHIFDSYFTYQRKEETIEEYVKKPLERFGEDLMKWNEQLRNDKEFQIYLLKRYKDQEYYNTLNYMVERTFKQFCKKFIPIDTEPQDDIESKWISKCYNAGLMYLNDEYKDTKVKCYGYDYKSAYQNNLTKIYIPVRRGKEELIYRLPDKLKQGYYHCKIYLNDDDDNYNGDTMFSYKKKLINACFSFSKHNVYTNDQIAYARWLKKHHFKTLNIELQFPKDNANCYLYKSKDIIRGGKIFYMWNKALTELRKRYPDNKIIKMLGSRLWGCLSKPNVIRKTLKEIEDENLDLRNGKYKLGEEYFDDDLNVKYVELIERNRPYKFDLRVKPFITSYGRIKSGKLALKDLKNVLRVQTDNVTFLKEHKEFESDELKLESKTTGKMKWSNINRYYQRCKDCKTYYNPKYDHEC